MSNTSDYERATLAGIERTDNISFPGIIVQLMYAGISSTDRPAIEKAISEFLAAGTIRLAPVIEGNHLPRYEITPLGVERLNYLFRNTEIDARQKGEDEVDPEFRALLEEEAAIVLAGYAEVRPLRAKQLAEELGLTRLFEEALRFNSKQRKITAAKS